jgi:hypothetical protein
MINIIILINTPLNTWKPWKPVIVKKKFVKLLEEAVPSALMKGFLPHHAPSWNK